MAGWNKPKYQPGDSVREAGKPGGFCYECVLRLECFRNDDEPTREHLFKVIHPWMDASVCVFHFNWNIVLNKYLLYFRGNWQRRGRRWENKTMVLLGITFHLHGFVYNKIWKFVSGLSHLFAFWRRRKSKRKYCERNWNGIWIGLESRCGGRLSS